MNKSILSGPALAGVALAGRSSPAAAGDTVIVTSPAPQITAMAFLPGSTSALITEMADKLKLWRHGQSVRHVRAALRAGGRRGRPPAQLVPALAGS